MPVITAALFARFASRQDESFAAKVNAALRNQFGGHAVKLEADRERRPSTTRCSKGSACGGGPDPCILVIFGASGDLTSKKLMPALYSLAVRRPAAREVRRSSARRAPRRRDDEFRERMKQAVQGACARPVRRGDVGRARRRDALRHARLRRRQGRGRAARRAHEARRGARDRRQPRLLLRGPAERRSARSSRRSRSAAPPRAGSG